MACYHPITIVNKKAVPGSLNVNITVPCGQCIGCRLEKSRMWAVRCVHEARLHVRNCFITLTYDDNHLSRCPQGSLNKRDWVLFMKKLRKQYGVNIRFYHCGEYGEKHERPHHHACIFNHDFMDKYLWSTRNGVKLYRSEELDKIWGYGYTTIGEVTFESAAYCARYVMKKLTGPGASVYNGKEPEYCTMSRKPGIGNEFLKKYLLDIYTTDMVVVKNDLTCRPPRYYDNIYDSINHEDLINKKEKRKQNINIENNTIERRIHREELAIVSIKRRSYESR